MEYPSNCKSSNHLFDLKDQIYEKIAKAKSVLTCVMFATEFIRDDMVLDKRTLYHALWATDGYLEELEMLFNQLEEVH